MDLAVESIEHPDKHPLVSQARSVGSVQPTRKARGKLGKPKPSRQAPAPLKRSRRVNLATLDGAVPRARDQRLIVPGPVIPSNAVLMLASRLPYTLAA